MEPPRAINRSPGGRYARVWTIVERAAWAVALVCIASWTAIYIDGLISRRRQMDRFAAVKAAALQRLDTPDQSLWSPQRIVAWRSAVKDAGPAPLAILRIPRIHFEAPVLEGTDDISLNRGVGHIEETARPGADGNSGIAGHRDGYFRGLKDIGPGDVIELETVRATEVYRVDRTWIVGPEDVSVLDPTPIRSLTLVTCYPFYFVGSAPQRFIVRAVLAADASTSVRRQP